MSNFEPFTPKRFSKKPEYIGKGIHAGRRSELTKIRMSELCSVCGQPYGAHYYGVCPKKWDVFSKPSY